MIDRISLAPEVAQKIPSDDNVLLKFDFANQLGSSESISSVDNVTFTPSAETSFSVGTASIVTGGKIVQVPVSGGLASLGFTALKTTDELFAEGNVYREGYRVRVCEDNEEDLPRGLSDDDWYFVRNPGTDDTFRLSKEPDGTLIDIQSNGRGKIWMEYIVTVLVTTSSGQERTGEQRVWVRS